MTGFPRDRKSHRSSKDLHTSQYIRLSVKALSYLRMELLEVRCCEACFGIDDSSARDLLIDAKNPTAFYFYVEHPEKFGMANTKV
jgi:hypothetical protein